MRYPKKEKIEAVLRGIKNDDFSDTLPANASHIDKTKYDLCKKFVTYLNEGKMTQAELARQLGIDRSRINWIVKYKIDNFTIDKLYELWSMLDPDFELKVS